jgi:hypothetical protein
VFIAVSITLVADLGQKLRMGRCSKTVLENLSDELNKFFYHIK